MKVSSLTQIQSYILTSAKYTYSIYEKRILYRIIELLQDTAPDEKNFEMKKYTINKTLFDDVDIVMPISAFLKDEKDNNYKRAKDALLSLNKKIIEFESSTKWAAFNLIERPEVDKIGDCVSFRVSPTIAKVFLDFSKGYSKYELQTAMSFESIYSMRFYELLYSQTRMIQFNIDNLKVMFQLEKKYKNNVDFVRYVIDVAKAELDAKSWKSFTYELVRKNNNPKGKITGIKFFPLIVQKNKKSHNLSLEDKQLKEQSSLHWDLERAITLYLRDVFIFTDVEIKNNIELLKNASDKGDLLYFLSTLKKGAEKAKSPQAYVIGAIKKHLNPVQVNPKDVVKKPRVLTKKEQTAISELTKAEMSKLDLNSNEFDDYIKNLNLKITSSEE